MTDQDVPFATEPPSQLLDDRHRAMTSSRAAHADRDVELPFLLELRKREPQQAFDVTRDLESVGAEDELRDLWIARLADEHRAAGRSRRGYTLPSAA